MTLYVMKLGVFIFYYRILLSKVHLGLLNNLLFSFLLLSRYAHLKYIIRTYKRGWPRLVVSEVANCWTGHPSRNLKIQISSRCHNYFTKKKEPTYYNINSGKMIDTRTNLMDQPTGGPHKGRHYKRRQIDNISFWMRFFSI